MTRTDTRQSHAPIRRHVIAAGVVVSLVAAGCSNAGESASVDERAVPTTLVSDSPTTTETPQRLFPPDPALEIPADLELAFADDTSADPGGSTAGGAIDSTPRPPVGAPTPAEGGSTAGYVGLLGFYTLDQVLATSPIDAPVVVPGTAPLTGLPGAPVGPAVVVKIDNSGNARPQAGLNAADVVIEEEVEWGITRFAAIFHSEHRAVGPVRSGRSTDISFLSSLGEPAFVYSGANDIFDALLLDQERVRNFSAARNGGYWRQSGRRAPSNLFADTTSFVGTGAQPPAWFAFRAPGVGSTGTATSEVRVNWPNTAVRWQWDGAGWARTQNGSAHVDADGVQVVAANVVVAETAVVDTGLGDSAGGAVPEYVWAGSGPVSVFTDGRRIDGTWYRETLGDPAILVAADGTAIELTPGQTWIELVGPGAMSSS